LHLAEEIFCLLNVVGAHELLQTRNEILQIHELVQFLMSSAVERFHELLVQQQPIPVLGALPSQPCNFVHREPNVKLQERCL
jgi:hypothetical protein